MRNNGRIFCKKYIYTFFNFLLKQKERSRDKISILQFFFHLFNNLFRAVSLVRFESIPTHKYLTPITPRLHNLITLALSLMNKAAATSITKLHKAHSVYIVIDNKQYYSGPDPLDSLDRSRFVASILRNFPLNLSQLSTEFFQSSRSFSFRENSSPSLSLVKCIAHKINTCAKIFQKMIEQYHPSNETILTLVEGV